MERRWVRLEACEIDLERRVVRRDDGDRTLTVQEADLLEHLVVRAGTPVGRGELLRHVWGYPGPHAPDTRAVDIAIRRLRSKIERDPAAPRHVVTQRGSGYRFEPLHPLERPEDVLAAPQGSVPAEPPGFVGREEVLARVDDVLAERRWVGLVGPVGVGKTRLALRAATTWWRAGRPVWWVVGTGATPAELASRIAGEGPPDVDEAAAMQRVIRVLGRRGPHVLVLDDPPEASWRSVRTLLDRLPELRVLTTSRTAPDEAAARVEVPPLPMADAVALLLARARVQRPDWGKDDEVVERIARELDGLPLAIELAAQRARVLTPTLLLEALRDRFRILSDGDASLRGALALSWSLLDDVQRQALAQLSVFRGGFGVEAAAAVVVLPEGSPWVLDWLGQLVDHSWLGTTEARGRTRFTMLESQRRFAQEQLPDGDPVRLRHLGWAVELATAKVEALRASDGDAARAELTMELPNLWEAHRAALELAPDRIVATALALDAALEEGGSVRERLALTGLATRSATEPRDLARAHLARAVVLLRMARAEEAGGDLSEARAAVRRLVEPALLARIENRDAARLAEQGAREEAATVARSALELASAIGDRFEQALAHGTLGQLAAVARDLPTAERHHRAMRTLADELGSWRLQLRARGQLATIARAHGRLADAEQHTRVALALAREHGDVVREALLLVNLASLAGVAGRQEEALSHVDAALVLHRSVGDRVGELRALANGGILRVGAGRPAEGRAWLEEAVGLADAGDDGRQVGAIHGNLGVCLLQLDDARSARRHLERAVELVGGFPSAYFHVHLAVAASEVDDPDAARAALETARPGLSGPVADGLIAVAEAHRALADARAGDPEAEARAMALADRARSTRSRRGAGDLTSALLPGELDAALAVLSRAMQRHEGVTPT
ncbi:MAG: winged helix-turn-helix domain-containing protein [Alphaproteobacteria bacterium]|nr:winged helix-turn-helix domain-containing protein [Alphaproteobacteria bacterium]